MQVRQFPFKPFSQKDIQVLSWWLNPKYKNIETLICDGSIRSGKTLCMSISYILYTMHNFNNTDHIFLGDSIGALYRNVINRLVMIFAARGYNIKDNRSQHVLTFQYGGKTNRYYLFGANNSKSPNAIRGLTAGCMFADEVAEMPEETVRVATQRCNFDKSTYWFNCNPTGPYNWFKQKWINHLDRHHALRIPFRLEDNPALSQHVIDRYKRSYTGVAYERDILGKWVIASGLVYDNFNDDMIKPQPPRNETTKYIVSCDYGAQNPTTFLLWGYRRRTGRWYCLNEYFYDARHSPQNKDDRQYAIDLTHWLDQWQRGLRPPIIIDPAAQDFVIMCEHFGYHVLNTNKDVITGIRLCQVRMNQGKVVFCKNCIHTIREFHVYVWDEKAQQRGEDKVVKHHDHDMDAFRYFVVDMLPERTKQQDNGMQMFNSQF